MAKVGVCGRCLEQILRYHLGRRVAAESDSGQTFIGVLLGFKVRGKQMKVILREGGRFVVVEWVRKIEFLEAVSNG